MTAPPPIDLEALSRELDALDWNAAKAMAALYAHRQDKEALQSICLAMARLSDADLLSYLMQFCQMIIVFEMEALQQLLMTRCHHSKHFALRLFFLLQAAVEDEIPALMVKTNRLWKGTPSSMFLSSSFLSFFSILLLSFSRLIFSLSSPSRILPFSLTVL